MGLIQEYFDGTTGVFFRRNSIEETMSRSSGLPTNDEVDLLVAVDGFYLQILSLAPPLEEFVHGSIYAVSEFICGLRCLSNLLVKVLEETFLLFLTDLIPTDVLEFFQVCDTRNRHGLHSILVIFDFSSGERVLLR